MTRYPSDLEIAREATLRPMSEVAAPLGLSTDELLPYGHDKAKVKLSVQERLAGSAPGKLILVTAVSPTPAGEGKTTTTVGLGDALNRSGKQTTICLREPSLGPCFGMKGGAAGGGRAQVVPMEDINLHFTGDFHAITSAHNLLAAALDNHMHHGNKLDVDPRRISWSRVLDLNERALRQIVIGLGGLGNSVPREAGFEITAASEVMAVFALSSDLEDLKARLGRLRVGLTRGREPVTAADLNVHGAMTALLRDALAPNLVQTLENNPAFIHGGPFANIAHGCNSVIATRAGLKMADYVVTEAGFGADLGAEKFFDIKCRKAGLNPACAVVVATVRALKMHGGVARDALGEENVEAVVAGLDNLGRHLGNIAKYGVPAVVAVNRFTADTDAELTAVRDYCQERFGVEAFECTHWTDGGAGTEALATRVAEIADGGTASFKPIYADDVSLWDKMRTVAKEIYGADDISADAAVQGRFKQLQDAGFGHFPVCVAKTQYSFSTDPNAKGAPSGHVVPVRELRLAAGAEFVVAVCGDIMTMPGLPRVPAAEAIGLDDNGEVVGLF